MGSQVLASTQHTTRYRCCVYLLSRRPNKQNFKMKISLVLSLLGLSVCSASPQFGFLGQLFGGGRNRGRQNNRNRPSGGGGGGRCGGGNQPNHQFQGQGYLVSWRLGCSSFTQGGGESFCRSNGMRPISLDNSAKEREFLGLVSSEGQKYFWTGGMVRGRSISWPSGRSYNNVNWSNTGGARPPRPQPDNREGDEVCLAVLNNFYNDGVRLHDVSCHHRKPTICEAQSVESKNHQIWSKIQQPFVVG